MCSEPGVELTTGTLLLQTYGLKEMQRASTTGVLKSDDKGQTWSYLSVVADGSSWNSGEPALAVTRSGRLICMMRTGGYLLESTSEDNGSTWKKPWYTPLHAVESPANLLRLSNGDVLCTYGYRGEPGTVGVKAAISCDEGETWGPENIIVEGFPNWDCGYASSVELEDGRVLTTYYYNLLDRYYLGGSFYDPRRLKTNEKQQNSAQ